MIIGCGEWGFRNLPMEDHFRIAKDFGFHYLEFGIGGDQPGRLPEEPGDDDLEAFNALRKKYGLVTPFCCIENDFTLGDTAAHEAMMTKVLGQIRAAARFGATHVRLFAGFRAAADMNEPIWKQVIEAFRSSDDLCKELGVEIAIETHGGIEFNDDGSATHINSITTDRESLKRLLRDLPPRVGFNYDPGNIKAADPDDRRLALDLVNDRINYCHLKDWHRKGKGWVACAIGDDDLDYAPVFQQMEFSGVYQIEYEPLEDTEDGIRRSLKYLEKVAPGFRFS